MGAGERKGDKGPIPLVGGNAHKGVGGKKDVVSGLEEGFPALVEKGL